MSPLRDHGDASAAAAATTTTRLSDRMPDRGIFTLSDGTSILRRRDATTGELPDDVVAIEKHMMEELKISDRDKAKVSVQGFEHASHRFVSPGFGAYPDLVEDDVFLRDRFAAFDAELERIERKQKTGGDRPSLFDPYKLAREQNPRYIHSYRFKIDFLRAEVYSAGKAVQRMLKYLCQKLDLFGPEMMTRVIRWKDLGEDVEKFFQKGPLQILPETDRSGRLVLFSRGVIDDDSDETILVARKAYFYFWSTLPELDTEGGRFKGIVAILWNVHRPNGDPEKAMEAIRKIWQCSPVRASAFHMCQRIPVQNHSFAKNFTTEFLLKWFRRSGQLKLLRSHYGDAKDCTKFLVEEYGCPRSSLATVTDDMEHRDFINQWIVNRQAIESQMDQIMATRRNLAMTSSTTTNASSVLTAKDLSLNQRILQDLSMVMKDSSIRNTDTNLFWPTPTPIIQNIADGQVTMDNGSIVEEMGNTDRDIKFGRGKPLQQHPGNVWFRKLLESKYPEFLRADKEKKKEAKTELTKEILQILSNDNRRFIDAKPENQTRYWTEVDKKRARSKVAVGFRSITKQMKLDAKKGETDPSRRFGVSTIENIVNREITMDGPESNGLCFDKAIILMDDDELDSAMEQVQLLNGEMNGPIIEVERMGNIDRDIKLGRGKPKQQQHPGNEWYQGLLERRYPEFEKATGNGKTKIKKEIIELAANDNRRFIKAHPVGQTTYWREVDEGEALDKVAFGFQDYKSKMQIDEQER